MKWMLLGVVFFTAPVFAESKEECLKACKKNKRLCQKGCEYMMKDAPRKDIKACKKQCGIHDALCPEQCGIEEEEDE